MFGIYQDNDDLDRFSDQEIVARTLYGEARGEGYLGQQGVCNVIFNRAAKPGWWGTNPRDCALHPYQFSCWNNSDPNRSKIVAVTPEDSIYAQCYDIAGLAFSGQLDDITSGADSYQVIGTNARWAVGLNPCAIIGKQEFYKTK